MIHMSEPRPPVEAIDRALALLSALAAVGPGGTSLQTLAQRTNTNKSTAYRALASLRSRGFASQDMVTGYYSLGPAALQLSETYWGPDNLVALLHPALVAISTAVNELVHLGVLTSHQVLYLDRVEPERPIRVWSRIGQTVPTMTTALGRALLAYRGTTREQVFAYSDAAPRADRERSWRAIEQARVRGWATEYNENEPGIACVAVPLLRNGSAVAAISVTAPAERMEGTRPQEVAAAVVDVLPPLLPRGLYLP